MIAFDRCHHCGPITVINTWREPAQLFPGVCLIERVYGDVSEINRNRFPR
ncbi:hypothetical protein NPIL_222261, partial [Nephila pilipes]